jgi:hypothetical protein
MEGREDEGRTFPQNCGKVRRMNERWFVFGLRVTHHRPESFQAGLMGSDLFLGV